MIPVFNYTPNAAQMRNALIMAPITVNIWPRGQGKTFDIARQMIDVVHGLPFASSLFAGRTYKKLKRDIIPEICEALTKMGYLPDIHYVLYRRPEKSLEYPNPLKIPGEYDNVISWYTGHVVYLLSQDKDISARGKSVNFVFADELLEIKQDKFEAEVFPANRGNDEYYKDVPFNHGMFLCSSKPIGTADQWILQYSSYYKDNYQPLLRELTDMEVAFIDCSDSVKRAEIWKGIQELAKAIQWYPSTPVGAGDPVIFYNETRFWNNLRNLGWKYVMQQRRTMSDLRFRVEMLNMTLDRLDNGFYPSFSEKNIYYNSFNYQHIDHLPLHGVEEDGRWDADYDPMKHIIIGQDYGVNFNGMTVAQRHNMELRFINEFYVKDGQWMRDVIQQFCRYYKHHINKRIMYDCDHTGLNRNPNAPKLAYQAKAEFEKLGWEVIIRSTNKSIDPNQKYDIAHRVYANDPQNPEPGLLYVTINGNRCKNLITSIRLSPVKKVANGLAKDKSSEASKMIPQENATHFSDAHDFSLMAEYSRQAGEVSSIPLAIFPGR